MAKEELAVIVEESQELAAPVTLDYDLISRDVNDAFNSDVTVTHMPSAEWDDKKLLFNSLNNPTGKISDMRDKQINMVGFVMQPIYLMEKEGPEAGTVKRAIRTIIINSDGMSYGCSSMGIATALRNLVPMVGEGPWYDMPVPIIIREKTVGKNRVFTFDLA